LRVRNLNGLRQLLRECNKAATPNADAGIGAPSLASPQTRRMNIDSSANDNEQGNRSTRLDRLFFRYLFDALTAERGQKRK